MNEADKMALLLNKIRLIQESWDEEDDYNDIQDNSGYKFIEGTKGSYLINDADEILFIPDVWLGRDGYQQGSAELPEVWEWNESDPEAEAVKFTLPDVSKLEDLVNIVDPLGLIVPDLNDSNKDKVIKQLLILRKEGQLESVKNGIAGLRELGKNWPEFDIIEKSINADLKNK